jgi:flagellin-like hook-associated protein FlgL
MSQTSTDSPYRWRAADLEGIRIALSIPARMPAVRAINDAMAQLEEQYPDAIPTARRELDAIATIDTDRARFGATINRLTYAADNLANVSQNAQASRSRILDTDYAQTTTELARTQIIQQAATAMLAQANQAPQSVLSLLR